MIKCDDAIAIERSPADVFAFVADISNIPKWQTEVLQSKVLTPGATRVGTRYTEQIKMGSTHVNATCEVVDFVPGSMMGFTASSPAIEYRGRLLVEPWQMGSRLTMTGTARLKGWRKLMQPVMQRELRNVLRNELVTLKTILEAERTVAPRELKIARPA